MHLRCLAGRRPGCSDRGRSILELLCCSLPVPRCRSNPGRRWLRARFVLPIVMRRSRVAKRPCGDLAFETTLVASAHAGLLVLKKQIQDIETGYAHGQDATFSQKKPTRLNTLRCSTASAYSSTGSPPHRVALCPVIRRLRITFWMEQASGRLLNNSIIPLNMESKAMPRVAHSPSRSIHVVTRRVPPVNARGLGGQWWCVPHAFHDHMPARDRASDGQ
jgi:hypothetical protein